MAAAVGLYFYDSVLLLYCNQGILIPVGKRGWLVSFGSSNFRILGKDVFIPNPLLPHRALFRLSWQFDGCSLGVEEDWASYRKALLPMVPMVWCMAAALFLFLPLGFFTTLGNSMLISAVVLLYFSIIAALAWVWTKRKTFKLSGKRFAALAFESLVCSPFALNIIRTVSASMPVREDLTNVSRRLQNPADWNVTCMNLIVRLNEAVETEEDGSERLAMLIEHRRKLQEQCLLCP
jgi:hypothetical protein